MPVSDKHLKNLSEVLTQVVQPPLPMDLSDDQFTVFFKKIASDRVRFGRSDWKGRRVDALLWNYPNLKPSNQAALTRHIVDSWHTYKPSVSVPTETESVSNNRPDSFPVENGAVNTSETKPIPDTSAAGSTRQAPTPQIHSHQRKDWFDLLTDWVAAVVSLWK
jgi:hypothetical protein